MRIGVDTGGTFTDFVLEDGTELRHFKMPSTPEAPEQAVSKGCGDLAGYEFFHGTTVATNAILEGKLARTAFISTFRDLLFLGRQTRPALYDLEPNPVLPPVAREDCFEAPGRIAPDGTELEPLDLSNLPDLVGFPAAAVCLLFSYANPAHEFAVASKLKVPHVSLSHQVSPEFREYERACATVLNAGLAPIMSDYLGRLRGSLRFSRAAIMSSAGGLVSLQKAGDLPLVTAISGPAAGAVAVRALGKRLGKSRLVGFDMGGTSTDVTVVEGDFTYTSLAEMNGIPVRLHRVDIHSIGCGGGSVAWLDSANALRVGPRSAGAHPGPALYGKGGPTTVTDANFVLGRLPQDRLGVPTNPAAAHEAVDALAARLGTSPQNLSVAIIAVAEAQMARAIRKVTSERGRDPSEFALVSFGGAGGLHACAIAQALGIEEVIVPPRPGVFSAEGLLLAPETAERARTVLGQDFDAAAEFMRLVEDGARDLPNADRAILSADLRYRGQSHEVSAPAGCAIALTPARCSEAAHAVSRAAVEAGFHAEHERLYGLRRDDAPVEWVTLRVRLEKDAPPVTPRSSLPPTSKPADFSPVSGYAILDRASIPAEIPGPAIICQPGATTLVPHGWTARALESGELVVSIEYGSH